MTEERQFTPALGRADWTRFYDGALRLFTREQRWRTEVLRRLLPSDGYVLDVGCGTGSLALAMRRRLPDAMIVGLDPDREALAIAAAKAARERVKIDWQRGFASDAASGNREAAFDVVTCTLVLHQVPLAEKRAGLAAMHAALRPGGRLLLADYAKQRSRLMRVLVRLTVQLLDGRTDTQPNADGVLTRLLDEVGFADIDEAVRLPTPTGSISIFVARRAAPATEGAYDEGLAQAGRNIG